MRNIYILCQRYLDMNLESYTVGGIQTYIQSLSDIIIKMGGHPVIIQYAAKDNRCEIDGTSVIGVDTTGVKHLRSKNKRLHKEFRKEYEKQPGLLLYATEGLVYSKCIKEIPAIAIQHGISWDKPDYSKKNAIRYEFDFWLNNFINRITIRKIENLKLLVCVDYNYLNWYRALFAYPKLKTCIVPNFTEIPCECADIKKDESIVKIIFARRLVEYRGTRIFAKAIKQLLLENFKVDITIAGDGPDEEWLRKQLPEGDNIHYIKYKTIESLQIHKDKHIAVVPTIGSEGTSLSLLEAMASKCAVVCTNVGGMTNIVIDHYNGLMVSPDENELLHALKELLADSKLRQDLSNRAFETVKLAFSRDRWTEQWKAILQNFGSFGNL